MLRIGRLFGVPIYVHFSFVVTIVMWLSVSLLDEFSWKSVAKVGLQLAIFLLSLLIHEYSHIGVARYFGFTTDQVVINFFGFTARIPNLEAMSARQEFIMAVAGPAVSFLCVLCFDALSRCFPTGVIGSVSKQACYMNAWITLLNLIPALPLDGGRIFRSWLQQWFEKKRATYWGFRMSQLCAVLGVVVAVTSGLYMLIALSTFVWIAGRKEYEGECAV